MLAIWRRRRKEADPRNASTNGRGDAQRTMDWSFLLCRGATRTSSFVFGRTALWLQRNRRFYFPPSHIGRCFKTVASYTVCCVVLVSHRIWGFCPAVPRPAIRNFLEEGEYHACGTHTCFTRVIPGGFNHPAYEVIFLTQSLFFCFYFFQFKFVNSTNFPKLLEFFCQIIYLYQ